MQSIVMRFIISAFQNIAELSSQQVGFAINFASNLRLSSRAAHEVGLGIIQSSSWMCVKQWLLVGALDMVSNNPFAKPHDGFPTTPGFLIQENNLNPLLTENTICSIGLG